MTPWHVERQSGALRMTPAPSLALPLTGLQLAFFILAATLLGAAAARPIASFARLPHEALIYLSQLVTFGVGAVSLLAIPAFRRKTVALLRVPVPRGCYAEVALAVVVSVLGEFASFGLNAILKWHAGGDLAVARMALNPAKSLDAAFSASTMRDLAITCLLAPLIEEIFHRGFLLDAWMQTRTAATALILSAAFFAAMHPTWIHPFFGGLLLGAVYLRTGALRAAILIHFCANAANWYPLFGQFLIPSENHGIHSWTIQLACLATAPLFVLVYAWFAVRPRPPAVATESAARAA